jgi:flagellar assembly protein FliH
MRSTDLHGGGQIGRSPGLAVRRRPRDPGRLIDYVTLGGDDHEAGADPGREAGYAAGYAEGAAAARAEAETHARQTRLRVARAIDALARANEAATDAFAERRHELERSVAGFAFELVETLVGRELELASHPGRDAVARALASDRGAMPATARIHPDDAESLSSADVTGLAGARQLTFVVDPTVEPGGALVEIGGATIDSQWSTAVQRVCRLLVGPAADVETRAELEAGAGGPQVAP